MTVPSRVRNVVLVGYRGAGKTTVGRLLARRLGWDFIDTDAMVEEEAGRSVADLFAAEGEEAFRRREEVAVARALGRGGAVIALGGGAVTREANRALLPGAGLVVFLEAPEGELARRMEREPGKRPPLHGAGGLEEVRRLLPLRLPHYRAVAHRTLETSGRPPEEVACEILRLIDGARGAR